MPERWRLAGIASRNRAPCERGKAVTAACRAAGAPAGGSDGSGSLYTAPGHSTSDAGGTPALRLAARTPPALRTRPRNVGRRMPARRRRSGTRCGRLRIALHGCGSFDVGCRRDAGAPARGADGAGSHYTAMVRSTSDPGGTPALPGGPRTAPDRLTRLWLLLRRRPASRRQSENGRGLTRPHAPHAILLRTPDALRYSRVHPSCAWALAKREVHRGERSPDVFDRRGP
jgi:hypothetical protein